MSSTRTIQKPVTPHSSSPQVTCNTANGLEQHEFCSKSRVPNVPPRLVFNLSGVQKEVTRRTREARFQIPCTLFCSFR